MARDLRALEFSLKCRTSQHQKLAAEGKRMMAKGVALAKINQPHSLSPNTLQDEIDIVRGRKLTQPTRTLRALENHLLGHDTDSSSPKRETLRLDHGQAPQQVPLQASRRTMTNQQSYVPATNLVEPLSYHQWSEQHKLPAVIASTYSPELSAPDVGRFQVESFSDQPQSPDDLFNPSPAVAPATPSPAPALLSERATAGFIGQPTYQPAVGSDDNGNWLIQAQSEQPQVITAASKKHLDSGLSMAKDDFERELAVILGTPPTQAVAAQQPDLLFENAQPQQLPTVPAAPAAVQDSNSPPPHPTHDVFEQMGKGMSMRYANSFDLGNVNLNERFNMFERELEQPPVLATREPALSMSSPFVDPMSLNEFDLVAELAEIGAEHPAQSPAVSNKTENPIENTPGEYHDEPVS